MGRGEEVREEDRREICFVYRWKEGRKDIIMGGRENKERYNKRRSKYIPVVQGYGERGGREGWQQPGIP